MNLPEGTHLAYAVTQPDRSLDRTAVAELTIRLSDDSEPGAEWDIIAQGLAPGGQPCTVLHIYDDGYCAIHQIPEFFAALAEMKPTTIPSIQRILDELGAINETRSSPQEQR